MSFFRVMLQSDSKHILVTLEVQKKRTVEQNTVMSYSTVLHVSAHQNSHQAIFITKLHKA
jgi:hypothetical protein